MVATKQVKVIDENCFDPVTYDLYWRFLAERQNAYVRRVVMSKPWPWSYDPILQAEFITNVYRRLDPGTTYVINEVLSVEAEEIDIVFNVMLYRLMGSVPSTHKHLGFQKVADFDKDAFLDRLRELPDEHRIFGDAYRVASYSDQGSDSKIENVAAMFEYLAEGMEETIRRISAARSVVEVYKLFESMKGFGEFLSHQIVVDLLYVNNEGDTIVTFGENQFAKAGPGARKGIWKLLAEDVKPANLTIVMEYLQSVQAEEFTKRDIDFAYLEHYDGQPYHMSLCDIQASLCEFYKYHRLWSGDSKVQTRRYLPEHSRLLEDTVPILVSEDLLHALEGDLRLTFDPPQEPTKTPQEEAEALEEDDPSPSPLRVEVNAPEWPEDFLGVESLLTDSEPTTQTIEAAPGVTINITINVTKG